MVMEFSSINLNNLVHKLYDPTRSGIEVVSGLLSEEFRKELLDVVKVHRKLFTRSEEQYGIIRQQLDWLNLEDADIDVRGLPTDLREVFHRFVLEYELFYAQLNLHAGFEKGPLNAVSIYHFDPNGIGMQLHREWKTTRNVITIIPLEGNAEYITDRGEGSTTTRIEYAQGDGILLRAPRNDEEWKIVPRHAVENIPTGHYSLTIRRKTDYPDHTLDLLPVFCDG